MKNARRDSAERNDRIKIVVPALLVTVIGFVVAYQFVEPAPPSKIVIATGSETGAYYKNALKYREALEESGIELELRSTKGSVENLKLLSAGEVDIAFLQGGIGDAEKEPTLRALGSVYREPLWLFHRAAVKVADLRDLADLKVSVGADGSGTRPVATQLLADNGVADRVKLQSLGTDAAIEALLKAEIDALFIVASEAAGSVQKLVHQDGVSLLSFSRASAYVRHHSYLSRIILSQGVLDLGGNVPVKDKTLLAPAATLVVREGFHAALVSIILEVASETHSDLGVLQDAGEFPSSLYTDFPLRKEAKLYHEHGLSFLYRVFPFWVAALADRLKIMLLPLLTLLIPLFKLVPPLYRWRIRSRVHRQYKELLRLEGQIGEEDPAKLAAALDAISKEILDLEIPPSYADELYHLRSHVQIVRSRLAVPADSGADSSDGSAG
ncbi:MAG: TAXI family TRAP transporter solute-binding subunit [Planctomycetota bacterium]